MVTLAHLEMDKQLRCRICLMGAFTNRVLPGVTKCHSHQQPMDLGTLKIVCSNSRCNESVRGKFGAKAIEHFPNYGVECKRSATIFANGVADVGITL